MKRTVLSWVTDAAGDLVKNGVPWTEDEARRAFRYLTGPYITTVALGEIPNRQDWAPTPCRATETCRSPADVTAQ